MSDPGLESVRKGNPAARALPLLSLLALGDEGNVIIERSVDSHLSVQLART
jgi:hypothetical protein